MRLGKLSGMVLVTEPRTLCTLGECATTKLHT